MARYVVIWFRYLKTDRMIIRQPELREVPFALAAKQRGRMVITASSKMAIATGITEGMVVADARSVLPGLQVMEEHNDIAAQLLTALATSCLRFTPTVAIDLPDGLVLDISGCAHLWGGERPYLKDILCKLKNAGYHVRAAIADTIGTAWAIARFGRIKAIIEPGGQMESLLSLPPAALRLEPFITQRLQKLGLLRIEQFIRMPRSVLRRRFGKALLFRLDQALGAEAEVITPVVPIEPYQERLPVFDPIRTAAGIEIALKKLLDKLCLRLARESKGLRKCVLQGHRLDGNVQQIEINTTRASRNVLHLFKLFELKIPGIEPDLGIELFILTAIVVEDLLAEQETFWNVSGTNDQSSIAELLDRLASRSGITISRFLPDEHTWPERAIQRTVTLSDKPATEWRLDLPRPILLLSQPEQIEVTVPIPDYPPMHFHYKGKLHKVIKADGPERIEQEWWIQDGRYRDYYVVEDEQGARYWLFRSGSYDTGIPKWYLHGFFA